MRLVAEVAEACLVSQEATHLQNLMHTVKIIAPTVSHLGLHLYMQHSSRLPELTESGSCPVLALICAWRSQRTLSTDQSLDAALLAMHHGQRPVSTSLPAGERLYVFSLDTGALYPVHS